MNKEILDMLDPLLWTFRGKLQSMLTAHMVTAYLRGSAQMVEYGRTITTDRPIFFEGPPLQEAIDYANKHCAQLVTKMDEETKDRLARVIGDAIEGKRGIPGLSRDIRKEFGDMSKYRSQLIARTETNDALSEAGMRSMKRLGVTGKEWIRGTSSPLFDENCEICAENEAAGVIPINDAFPSGDMRPPGHPSCICACVPVMLEEEK